MSITRESGPLKWNLNSILAIAGASLTVLVYIIGFTILWTNNARDVKDLNTQVAAISKRLDDEASDRKDRIREFSKVITDTQTQIASFVPMTYQINQATTTASANAEAIKQTNVRIDRVVETVGTKLDAVLDSVNKLAANVAVINSKIEDQRPLPQKSVWVNPIPTFH